jgi:hypothetical protein
LDAFKVLGLIVLEKDRQQDRVGLVAGHGVVVVQDVIVQGMGSDRRFGGTFSAWKERRWLTLPTPMLPCSYSNATFKMQLF